MPATLLRLSILLLAAKLMPAMAHEVIVRRSTKVAIPGNVDSNSPAFWLDGKLLWYSSHGRPQLSEGPSQFGPWTTSEIDMLDTEPLPHWMEAVYVGEDKKLWGWYHCEPIDLVPSSTLTAPKIGAVVSLDGGRTLSDLGTILESGDPLNPLAQNGYFAGGHGDCSVIADREGDHLYFFFGNYGGAVESQGVVAARMAINDRANPGGNVWKYYDGQWQEPGRGGRVTPIFPVRRAWGTRDPDAFWGPAVHWNTYLQCYVMLLNHASGVPGWSQEGVYISFCTDLSRPETWTPPVRILDKSQFSGWYFFYPQVMGLEPGATDTTAGQIARLYVGGVSKWEIEFVRTEPVADPIFAPQAVAQISPDSGATTVGEAAAFSVVATGTSPMTYQWFRDGAAIPGATGEKYTIAAVALGDAGEYTVAVTNRAGSMIAGPVQLTVNPPPGPPAFLSGFSVRALSGGGGLPLTAGFVIKSPSSKQLLFRALGPSLAQFGIVGFAPNVRLCVYDAGGMEIPEIDDGLAAAGIDPATGEVFSLLPGNADATLVAELPPGAATAQVQVSPLGVALLEVGDPHAESHTRIVQFSARAEIGAGEQAMIGGFTVTGRGTTRLLIRAVGPSLAKFGVGEALPNPVLRVFDASHQSLASNDDLAGEAVAAAQAAGAFPISTGAKDAAVVVTLEAGSAYTAVATSADERNGEVLIETYELP